MAGENRVLAKRGGHKLSPNVSDCIARLARISHTHNAKYWGNNDDFITADMKIMPRQGNFIAHIAGCARNLICTSKMRTYANALIPGKTTADTLLHSGYPHAWRKIIYESIILLELFRATICNYETLPKDILNSPGG